MTSIQHDPAAQDFEGGPADALLLVSFGGPEGPDDVLPFLENVTRGRGIPPERLVEVAEHYYRFGGKSPINDQNRALLGALRGELDLPVYWGNRNWDPYLTDAVAQMRDDGVRRAYAFVTSANSSWSGCRQYREDIARAQASVRGAPEVAKLRHYYNHPAFIACFASATRAALDRLPAKARLGAHLVFTAHSIPTSMAATAGPSGGAYVAQLTETAGLVVAELGEDLSWELVFQSRSGPPSVPWLEPDVVDHVEKLAAGGAPGAVIVPIGFVSDHLEVRYDLDSEARERAAELRFPLERATTPGDDPRFVAMVRELVEERRSGTTGRAALGRPSHDRCPVGCCAAPARPRPDAQS